MEIKKTLASLALIGTLAVTAGCVGIEVRRGCRPPHRKPTYKQRHTEYAGKKFRDFRKRHMQRHMPFYIKRGRGRYQLGRPRGPRRDRQHYQGPKQGRRQRR